METTPIKREKLYTLIREVLSNGIELTAHEISVDLFNRGRLETSTRQEVAPRLTELERMGDVERCGTKIDEHTRKKVSIYKLVRSEQ